MLSLGRGAPDGDEPAAAVGVRRGVVRPRPRPLRHGLLRPAARRAFAARHRPALQRQYTIYTHFITQQCASCNTSLTYVIIARTIYG